MSKNVGENLSDKYRQKRHYQTTQSQKTAEATGDLIGHKIANITNNSLQSNSETYSQTEESQ